MGVWYGAYCDVENEEGLSHSAYSSHTQVKAWFDSNPSRHDTHIQSRTELQFQSRPVLRSAVGRAPNLTKMDEPCLAIILRIHTTGFHQRRLASDRWTPVSSSPRCRTLGSFITRAWSTEECSIKYGSSGCGNRPCLSRTKGTFLLCPPQTFIALTHCRQRQRQKSVI